MNSTLIYTHDACLDHRPGSHHPESPQRLLVVLEALRAPEFDHLAWRDAPLGSREQLLLVHEADYVDTVHALSPSHGLRALDAGDTVMSPGTLQAAMRCVGAACAAVDAVVAGEAANAFCATRPCGHHAEADRAMGFCVFNQAAIAALHARSAHGLQRVAVVDFDVHHGNGTQHSFDRDPELFYGSCHQYPFYPGTGARSETGVARNIVNVPLSPGCDSATMRDAALFVDRRESTLNESGDFLFAQVDGAVTPESIRSELGDVLAGQAEGRRNDREITVFKSLGIAVEDLAASELAVRNAEAAGRGTVVAW